jgi:DNA-binding LacI/PurR family transcriptional regulator
MARSANQRDLARAAGVSISTVSRALSNSRSISSELRTQIQDLAKELGYQGRGGAPLEARLVRTYVTVNLMSGGLVAFYSALVEALRSAAAAAGLVLEVRMVRHSLDVERLSQDEADSPAAATLLIGLDVTPDISSFFNPDRPMVLVNTFDPPMRYDCVAPNNFYGAALSAQSLLDAGHRHLLHIREQIRWTTIQRVNGFFSAIAGVPGATGEILDIADNGDAMLAAAAKLKAGGKAKWTAVHAVHDSGAIRFIHALEEVGLRVPRDVSVIGFDDLPAASLMTPRLSTMRVDYDSIGRQAIALLLRRIAEPGSARLQVECGVTPVAGGTISQIAAA